MQYTRIHMLIFERSWLYPLVTHPQYNHHNIRPGSRWPFFTAQFATITVLYIHFQHQRHQPLPASSPPPLLISRHQQQYQWTEVRSCANILGNVVSPIPRSTNTVSFSGNTRDVSNGFRILWSGLGAARAYTFSVKLLKLTLTKYCLLILSQCIAPIFT